MLRPQHTATRERSHAAGSGGFRLDSAGECRAAECFKDHLRGAGEMAVPAGFNHIAADAAVRD